MNAVIFLCPISGFNQQLAEDINVNRLVRFPLGIHHILSEMFVAVRLDRPVGEGLQEQAARQCHLYPPPQQSRSSAREA